MKVRVVNKNTLPFVKEWREEKYNIPAGGFIEMEYDKAKAFIRHPSPMKMTGQGPDPAGFQMLEIPVEDLKKARDWEQTKVVAYKSHADGSLHPTQEALETYEKQFTAKRAKEKDK